MKNEKRIKAIRDAMGSSSRLTRKESLWCKQNDIGPPILNGNQNKVMVFADGEPSESLNLCRAVMEKFPQSGIITVIFDSADAKL